MNDIDVDLDTARIHVASGGSGRPELVLVHGFGCALDDWQHQIARFEGERCVQAMDLRGHGASTGQGADCTLERLARDVAELLRRLDLRAAVLVGHSMGCRVVLEAYGHARDRVAGVVLLDGSRLGAQPGDGARMRETIQSIGYAAFARALFGEALLTDDAAGQAVTERAANLRREVGTTLFPSMVEWDAVCMEAALAAVAVPLMAVQSTYLNPERKRVRLQPGQSSPWLDLVRSRAAQPRIEIVPDAGHFTMLDQPEAVNRLLADFIGRLPAA
jgi:pimeloyl-ACP methyl ester carboxylesterase